MPVLHVKLSELSLVKVNAENVYIWLGPFVTVSSLNILRIFMFPSGRKHALGCRAEMADAFLSSIILFEKIYLHIKIKRVCLVFFCKLRASYALKGAFYISYI